MGKAPRSKQKRGVGGEGWLRVAYVLVPREDQTVEGLSHDNHHTTIHASAAAAVCSPVLSFFIVINFVYQNILDICIK